MTKIPKHLQKKVESKYLSQKRVLVSAYSNETFNAGAAAMHSLMLEELKPIVEVLQVYKSGVCLRIDGEVNTKHAEKALAHFKERIEAQNDPT